MRNDLSEAKSQSAFDQRELRELQEKASKHKLMRGVVLIKNVFAV